MSKGLVLETQGTSEGPERFGSEIRTLMATVGFFRETQR